MCHCLTFSLEILPRGAPGLPVGSPPTMPGCVEGENGRPGKVERVEEKTRADGRR